jgi:glycerol uptake facilitator-like aquaporin
MYVFVVCVSFVLCVFGIAHARHNPSVPCSLALARALTLVGGIVVSCEVAFVGQCQ